MNSRLSPKKRNRSALGVALLLWAIALLVAWQTWSGLSHVKQMMNDRSATLQRMAGTELRNVARYGAARRERLDEVIREIADSKDVEGVLLERVDKKVRFAHGKLPAIVPIQPGLHMNGTTLLVTGPVTIETMGCLEVPSETHHDGSQPACCSADSHGNEHGCAGGAASGLDGAYHVVLALDATPYLRIRRSVKWQGIAGGLILIALGGALFRHQRQTRRNAEIRQALAIVDERARYLERLSIVAGGLAHEMKNPIGSLRGFAQLIGEKMAPDSPEAEYANLMVAELDSITRRVNGLRQFAQPTPPQMHPGYPAEILHRIALLLGPDLASRQLSLVVDAPDAPGPQAEIDEDRLRDLIVNLMTNAIEASPKHGTIHMRLSLDKEHWTLEVDDEGSGIPTDEREAVLRPFHSTKAEGLGLGLALAQRAVEDHRGHLEIKDAPGGGASLRATWPRRPTHDEG